ncbi:MAG: response regulator transcription factor [bacterium]
MGRCSIILADDHTLLRKGLKKILAEKAYLEVIGEATDGMELLELLKKSSPDMVVLDISMPHLRGLEALHEIRILCPAVKVLVLTMHKDKTYLVQAISAGADGYLLKEDADTELFTAIETIRRGRTYISPFFSGEAREDWVQMCRGGRNLPFSESLTLREREVLKLIAEGKSSKEIGDLLSISARTVERHRANMMTKLNVKKTADLVRYAIEKEYV